MFLDLVKVGLVFVISSLSIWLSDRVGVALGINKEEPVVMDRCIPRASSEVIGVFFAIGIDKPIGSFFC